MHDLRDRRQTRRLLHLQRRLEDGADLHLIDLGIGHAQAAAAVAQHGVGLVQFTRATLQLGGVQTRTGGQGVDVGVRVRDELVQRRVQQTDRHR
ncbi:hypothetical protein D3C78_1791040 [compost metagenome]